MLRVLSLLIGGLLTFATVGALSASAQNLDPQSRDLLIQKFERLKLQLPKEDSSYNSIVLRLADLLSERARYAMNKELEQGCNPCTAGSKDRKTAIEYYEQVLATLPDQQKNKVLLQMGHLYEMQDNTAKAVKLYTDIMNSSDNPEFKADIRMALGELYFKRRDFANARMHYQKALDYPDLRRKSLASYRVAWSNFQQGDVAAAKAMLVKMLKTPELLTTNYNGQSASIDSQFHQEVSRDLATFMSRGGISASDVSQLYTLSEDGVKIDNISYLASELERLGHKGPAIHAWEFIQGKQTGELPKLETSVHLAQLYKDTGDVTKSLEQMRQALAVSGTLKSCEEPQCKELRVRLRNYVVEWNKAEKAMPSDDLITAYQQYIEVYNDDAEMNIWLAQAALQKKNYTLAFESYKKAAALQSGKEKETNLLKVIEVAELSKDAGMIGSARQYYLDNTELGEQKLAVQYQLAHELYKAGDYQNASEALRAIALSKETGDQKLKVQAADLALDSLTFLKDNVKIQTWGTEFASIWPDKAKSYKTIATKASFNEVEKLASDNNQEAAWVQLTAIDLSNATEQEKITYYKNKLILAEKLQKFSDARSAVNELLSFKSLTDEDKQYALSRRAWLSELSLDFKTAYESTEKLSPKLLPEENKNLKMAMLADLAGLDPSPYYRNYIKTGKDESTKVAMAIKLAKASKTPSKEIQQYRSLLQKEPEVLAELIYSSALASKDEKALTALASDKSLAKTYAAELAWKRKFFADFEKLKKDITSDQFDASTQGKLAKSLKTRAALLTRAEQLLKSAVEKTDWTGQLLTVSLLAGESERFYTEVMSLPLPDGLTPEQQNEYMGLLSQQAAPYQVQAEDLKKKIPEFWKDENAYVSIAKANATETRPAIKEVVAQEYQLVSDLASPEIKTAMTAAQTQTTVAEAAPVDPRGLEAARSQVRLSPMDKGALTELLDLEKKAGNETMAAYLEARIKDLDSKNSKGEVQL